ncbi:unnamed protein product [Protopolystoma xenopodis]|uniref:FAS1 domain-containing protein n=1 Tax=Protopolystoma xenopodis TaxID=117903 RepID=A0A3S4ZBP1_9PLAT|nr:unnamed protein product [Protopolystoma xenopodis]
MVHCHRSTPARDVDNTYARSKMQSTLDDNNVWKLSFASVFNNLQDCFSSTRICWPKFSHRLRLGHQRLFCPEQHQTLPKLPIKQSKNVHLKPISEAIDNIPILLTFLLGLPCGSKDLVKVHIVKGRNSRKDLKDGMEMESLLDGQKLRVSRYPHGLRRPIMVTNKRPEQCHVFGNVDLKKPLPSE